MAGGKGGKKRGASVNESSSRGGTKATISSSSRPSDSSQNSGAGDAVQKKKDLAFQEASRRSIACKQTSISDVKSVIWRLKTDQDGNIQSIDERGAIQSNYDGLKEVLDARRKLFKKVRSMSIQGVPVTQPSENETYNMVEIELDSKVVLWLLFRQSDGYLIAFYVVPTKENPGGRFYFKDVNLPFDLEGNKLSWDSGYTKQVGITLGKGITLNLLECLLAFTPTSCHLKIFTPENSTSIGDWIYDRVRVLQTFMILFGECQRSGVFLQFAEQNFENGDAVPLHEELKDHLHDWSSKGRSFLALYVALLYKYYEVHGWNDKLIKAVHQMNGSVNALSAKEGHNRIKNYIVYEQDEDGNLPNYPASMTRLAGTGTDQLLHLINYDSDYVIDALMTMMKHGGSRSDPEVDVREV
ncbi:uncharacterized protein LOC119357539 [Triticum dicoccoides]|uniref:uncharacterized protein LOC119357539 n=1 Tax=Triticum dicoccoides TaxID=85692 RepID=UPI00188F4925|nr:uncharacterized protein LOC119357539 [Triticum dicoccoides]